MRESTHLPCQLDMLDLSAIPSLRPRGSSAERRLESRPTVGHSIEDADDGRHGTILAHYGLKLQIDAKGTVCVNGGLECHNWFVGCDCIANLLGHLQDRPKAADLCSERCLSTKALLPLATGDPRGGRPMSSALKTNCSSQAQLHPRYLVHFGRDSADAKRCCVQEELAQDAATTGRVAYQS